jgi:hypothetical protein
MRHVFMTRVAVAVIVILAAAIAVFAGIQN